MGVSTVVFGGWRRVNDWKTPPPASEAVRRVMAQLTTAAGGAGWRRAAQGGGGTCPPRTRRRCPGRARAEPRLGRRTARHATAVGYPPPAAPPLWAHWRGHHDWPAHAGPAQAGPAHAKTDGCHSRGQMSHVWPGRVCLVPRMGAPPSLRSTNHEWGPRKVRWVRPRDRPIRACPVTGKGPLHEGLGNHTCEKISRYTYVPRLKIPSRWLRRRRDGH